MTSPDLTPELAKSLLESLATWDPRASVPLALDYMALGDEEALQGFDAMALANPVADEMLQERYLSPAPDVEYLASLPDGSLGKAFERYLTENKLDPKLLRESAFIDAHYKRGDDVGYLAAGHGRHHRRMGPRAKGQVASWRTLGGVLGAAPHRAAQGIRSSLNSP